MGLFSFVCTLRALKANIALVGVQLFLTPSFSLLAGAFSQSAEEGANAGNLQIVCPSTPLHNQQNRISQQAGGACEFVAAMYGWYLFFSLMFSAVGFPFS